MKRLFATIISCLLLLSFAGCSPSLLDNSEPPKVEVQFSTDGTVNGYRTESSAITAGTATTAAYIGNSNSMRFHLPTCRSVSGMKEDHKLSFNSRDEAIAQGYTPCGICKP